MEKGYRRLDPEWKSFCASRRGRILFVKMSKELARSVCAQWLLRQSLPLEDKRSHKALCDLFAHIQALEADDGGTNSVFYSVPVLECQLNIEQMRSAGIESNDAKSPLSMFKKSLEQGVDRDPRVDWMARCGGEERISSPIDVSGFLV